MLVFIAGAISTGALVAVYSDDRKSSARPLANLPMVLAVAGATSSRSMLEAIAMCSMSALAPGFHWSVMTSRRVIASKVSGPTNAPRRSRHDGDDVVPVLLQAARDLHRLVGADAAGHAECDECHVSVLLGSGPVAGSCPAYCLNVLMMSSATFSSGESRDARRR